MTIQKQINRGSARILGRRALRVSLFTAAISLSGLSQAKDFGPDGMFSVNLFVQSEFQQTSNYCASCQAIPGAPKQYIWSDALLPGTAYGAGRTKTTQVQPWLGFNHDIGKGFKFSAMISQNYRNGPPDLLGFWRERDIAISHEDYGRFAYGDMMSRSWQIPNDSYASNLGINNEWNATGAGYGMLIHAYRYTSRVLDAGAGDLVLEATYSGGDPAWKINRPFFLELYSQYHKGPLVVDAIAQKTRNGGPSAWGQSPFTGLDYFPVDDSKLGSSGQAMALAMARYQVNAAWEVSGGIRKNQWSGAYAVETSTANNGQWNNPFNVNWGGTLNGVSNPGYPATSTDLMAGLRYRTGPWTAYTGVVYLGKAKTSNPLEQGQSNSALVNTVGLLYKFSNGISVYGFAGMVHYANQGLSPMSCTANDCGTNVDSRVITKGNWVGTGIRYSF